MRSELGRIWPTAKSAGVIGAPHGANYDAYANSYSTSEPTPPKGGSDDPLRGSLARTRKGGVEELRVPLTGPFDPVRGAPSLFASTLKRLHQIN